MKSYRVVLFVLSVVGVVAAGELFDLVKVENWNRDDVLTLEQAGCVVNGPAPDGRLLVEVPQRALPALTDGGYRLETVMSDIYGFYQRNALDYRFHTYSQIRDTFMQMAANNPGFVKFETLGLASNDSLLFALKITDNPDVEEDEPELMFEAAIHGDEKCATEPIFEWAAWLIRNYGVDPDVTYWVNTREIWVQCPTNPYGHIVGDRGNRNGYDCNRDYGFMWYYETSAREPFTQPETRAHARLAQRNAFNYWSSGHGGTYFISTPWSYTPYGARDSMEYWYLGGQYHNITGYPNGPGYRGMYQINGSSKDWAYGGAGAIGWTIETCIYKTPPVESLAQITAREHTAMKMVLANIDRGIRGMVTDSVTGLPVRARVKPMPIDFPGYCDSIGDFHRYLRPGTYSIVVEANGYAPKTVSNIAVTADTVSYVNLQLAPDTTRPVSLHKFIAGRGVSDVAIASTPDWALGLADGRRFSMGRGGMAIYDFGRQVFNMPGGDFTVYEDDGDPEGYRIEVANDWVGPWTSLGWDTGSASFDLGRGGVPTCRFVKVIDDSGATSGATAGFDLDAIEAVTANAAAVVFQERIVQDSAPGGNGDGKLDPGETAGLVVALRNIGRLPVADLEGWLSTPDTMVRVLDSTGAFGTLAPDSVRYCWTDKFRISARPNCPREYVARMKLRMTGTDYTDSCEFAITVGELRVTDPIPDGPRRPELYWAYDDVDSTYEVHPQYEWVEIRGLGTRLSLSDDQTVVVSLPPAFGPFVFYNQRYTQVSICGNGWVAPGSTTSSAYTNTGLPDGSAPTLIAMNWDDLYPPTGGGVWYYHDAANHRFIVEFDSVPYYNPRTTFEQNQLIIYDTTMAAGTGNSVFTLQYKTALGMSSSTVGDQDPSHQVGIQVLYNGTYHRAAAPLATGRAIKFTTDQYRGVEEAIPGSTLAVPLQVAPNPWGRGRPAFTLNLAQAGPVRLAVYDASGRRLRAVFDSGSRPVDAGTHRVCWDGRDERDRQVGAGVYLVRLETTAGIYGTKLVRAR